MMIKKAPKVAAMGGTKRERSVKGCGSCTPWAILLQAGDCGKCAFYRRVQLPSGGMRELCQLTGEKRPTCGMRGCHFLHGEWDRIDEVLGLTQREDAGKLATPNSMRLCNGLDHSQDGQKVARHSTAIHAHAGIYGNRALHIGRAQRPVSVRTGGIIEAGERWRPAFLFNPQLNEAHR